MPGPIHSLSPSPQLTSQPAQLAPHSASPADQDAQFIRSFNVPARLDQLAAKGLAGPDLRVVADAVNQWLSQGQGVAALRQQTLDLQNHPLRKADIPVGSILVRKEDFPQTTAQARTLMLQNVEGLNGIAGNTGDPNASHVLLWTAGDGNPVRSRPGQAGTVPEQVEARGGDHMQIQALAVQPGQYWVYAPKDRNVGDWAAQIGQMWEKVPYSRTSLGTAIKPTDQYTRMTAQARSDLVEVARDPFTASPAHARPAQDGHFESMTGKPRAPGECCSSFIVRLFQVAQAQVDLAQNRESRPGSLARAEKMTDQEIDAQLHQSVQNMSGLTANNADGMSPRSVEHFVRTGLDSRGEPQFGFKGVLDVKPQDVPYTEQEHHARPSVPV